MKKRIVVLLLATIMTVTTLTGCGDSATSAADTAPMEAYTASETISSISSCETALSVKLRMLRLPVIHSFAVIKAPPYMNIELLPGDNPYSRLT